jgi:hypothetical protein
MKLPLKKILFSNIILKAQSLIIGYTLWSILSASVPTTIWTEVPLSFYNESDQQTINAPETVKVNLRGNRSDLQTIDSKTLALHINAQALSIGPNSITISSRSLFLPETINVINYIPSNLVVTINEIAKTKNLS